MRKTKTKPMGNLAFLLLAVPLTLGCGFEISEPALRFGTPMPTIEALGWINGEAPAQDELAGKVVVLDCFATW